MRMFPKQPRRSGRIIRTMIVGRRGGSSGSESSSAGPQTYYVASVPGGRADLEISVVNGVPQAPVGLAGRSVELFSCPIGVAMAFDDGFGWNGSGLIFLPRVRLVADDYWESYAPGEINAGAINAGLGWSGSAALPVPYLGWAGAETFETYPSGPTGNLADGTGWNGAAAVIGY